MTFYDNTKEDSRAWRSFQDTAGQALDTAAVASAAALAAESTKQGRVNGIVVTPATATVTVAAPTVQLSATQLSLPIGTVTWTSSTPAVATVNASGLVTRVGNGTTTITATSLQGTGGKSGGLATTGAATITATA